MAPRTLLLILLCSPSCCASSESFRSDTGKLIYGATASVALARLQRARYKDKVNTRELDRLRKASARSDADSAALRDYILRTQLEASGFIRKTVLLGALLRGIESAFEQELLYESAEKRSASAASTRKRRRRPRVALATASAVIGLLALLEAQHAPGIATALHIGFHGSAWVWERLTIFNRGQ